MSSASASSATTYSLLKKTIQPWLVQLGEFYFAEYTSDDTENQVLITSFVRESLRNLEAWLERHPEASKRRWQNFTLAAALATFDLLAVNVDLRELWHRCRDKCDRREVEKIKMEMLVHAKSGSSGGNSEQSDDSEFLLTKPPSAVAATQPEDEKEETNTVPVETSPANSDDSASDSGTDTDDPFFDPAANLDEVADDDPQLNQYRTKQRSEPFKPAYIRYVFDTCFSQVWPFSTGADVPFPILECIGRVFRVYVLALHPAKTKEDVHNAAGGSLLAVLDYLQKLPKNATEAQLVCAIYDELGLSSKTGILQVWQNLRANPDLLAEKCAGVGASAGNGTPVSTSVTAPVTAPTSPAQ